MKIKVIDFGANKLPYRAHFNDAGADVYNPGDVYIANGDTANIDLGFGLEIPDGYVGFVFVRSSMARKGLSVELPPVDSGYRGSIHALVHNHSGETVKLDKGDRIGQLVILPVIIADYVYELDDQRGTGAFGSTGK